MKRALLKAIAFESFLLIGIFLFGSCQSREVDAIHDEYCPAIVSISVDNASVEYVLWYLAKYYHIVYFGDVSCFKHTKLVNIHEVNKPVTEVVQLMAKDQPFKVSWVGRTIVIYAK